MVRRDDDAAGIRCWRALAWCFAGAYAWLPLAGAASLDEALDNIDKDREFLTRGGVFTNDMIDAYIALKMEEVTRFRMTTHPVEYDMYYSL